MRSLLPLLLGLAIALTACATTIARETDDEIWIEFGIGGTIKETIAVYTKFWETGKQIKINTRLYSADAFVAYSMPGACYTKNAGISLHAASYLGIIPAYKITERLTSMLPLPLREWFQGHHGRYDWIWFATLYHAGLLEIWPEGACDQEAVLTPSVL